MKDGRDVLISIQSEREWKTFCAGVMQNPQLPEDPRFSTMVARVTNREATDTVVGELFASLTRDQLIARLDKADIAFGYEVPISVVELHWRYFLQPARWARLSAISLNPTCSHPSR